MSLRPGDVSTVSDLVGYQPGAVVSRQVMKGSAGSVTVFAFDAGEALSEHTTLHDALLHVLEGEAEVGLGGRQHSVAAGEAVVLPGGVPHSVRASERCKLVLTMLRRPEAG